jgi:hypothetical protein
MAYLEFNHKKGMIFAQKDHGDPSGNNDRYIETLQTSSIAEAKGYLKQLGQVIAEAESYADKNKKVDELRAVIKTAQEKLAAFEKKNQNRNA